MNFNLWKDYTPPAYLPPPLPTPKPRSNAYVIPHRQKPSRGPGNDLKFTLSALPSLLNFELTWSQFKQQKDEEDRIAKKTVETFSCRRCPAKFPSNTKLHERVRTKHKKPEKITSFVSSSVSLPTPWASPILSHATLPATSKKPIFGSEIVSQSKKPTIKSSRFRAWRSNMAYLLHRLLQILYPKNQKTC